MSSPESSEFKAYVEQLIEATRTGSMKWVEVNPTTFVWDTGEPQRARLTLQRVERVERVMIAGRLTQQKRITYLLSATDLRTNQTRLSLSGADDPDLNTAFENLYKLVIADKAHRNLEFLKSLLPPKNNP